MGKLLSIGYIFMSEIFKKIGEFSFFKNQRELENEYFFKFAETFLLLYIKEQLPLIYIKIIICLVFFYF